MGTVDIVTVGATVLGVVVTSLALCNRFIDWIFVDYRVVKIGGGLKAMETMTKISVQLRELGQIDWAEKLEADASRAALKPLAAFDDRRKHPAPFISVMAAFVSFCALVSSVIFNSFWPNLAPTVALASTCLLIGSLCLGIWTSTLAGKRQKGIVETRLQDARASR